MSTNCVSSTQSLTLIPCGIILGQDYSGYASSENAFSVLKRVKFYLHTTVLNNHIHHLMTCTVHKELVKELNLKQVTNDFVDRVERPSSIFGHFST